MSRTLLVGAFSALLTISLSQPAKALVTDWAVVKYHPTICYGDVISNTLTDDHANPIAGYTWLYKASGASTWINFSTLPNFTSVENAIGTQDIRLIVSYSSTSGGPAPPPTTIDHSITVQPPEFIILKSGTDINTPLGSKATIVFILQADDRDLNLYATIVSAQESLAFETFNDPPGGHTTGPGPGWIPTPEGQIPGSWEWTCQTIIDDKGCYDSPPFDYAGDDNWVYRVTQSNRVRLYNIDGTTPWYELGLAYDIEVHRVNSGTFKIILN